MLTKLTRVTNAALMRARNDDVFVTLLEAELEAAKTALMNLNDESMYRVAQGRARQLFDLLEAVNKAHTLEDKFGA